MKKWLFSVLTVLVFFSNPPLIFAANPPAVQNPPAKSDAKVSGRPFRGKIKSVDQRDKKIILEGAKAQTFSIIKESRIFKDDQTAKFSDLVVGDPVTGYVVKTPEGTWEARTIYAGKHASKPKT